MSPTIALILIALIVAAAVWQLWQSTSAQHLEPDASELQAGFEILHQSLHGLSQLNKLLLLKTVTFRRPPDVIAELMRDVAGASREAHRALKRHMKDEPSVRIKPEPGLGTDIRDAATQRNREEILGHPAQFELRFLTAQLQALLMVGIVAEQTARYDPNDARSIWLHGVADQFLALRERAFETLDQAWDRNALRGQSSRSPKRPPSATTPAAGAPAVMQQRPERDH